MKYTCKNHVNCIVDDISTLHTNIIFYKCRVSPVVINGSTGFTRVSKYILYGKIIRDKNHWLQQVKLPLSIYETFVPSKMQTVLRSRNRHITVKATESVQPWKFFLLSVSSFHIWHTSRNRYGRFICTQAQRVVWDAKNRRSDSRWCLAAPLVFALLWSGFFIKNPRTFIDKKGLLQQTKTF